MNIAVTRIISIDKLSLTLSENYALIISEMHVIGVKLSHSQL